MFCWSDSIVVLLALLLVGSVLLSNYPILSRSMYDYQSPQCAKVHRYQVVLSLHYKKGWAPIYVLKKRDHFTAGVLYLVTLVFKKKKYFCLPDHYKFLGRSCVCLSSLGSCVWIWVSMMYICATKKCVYGLLSEHKAFVTGIYLAPF